jgi:hypothetical protein
MAGTAKTTNFMLGSATVMIGQQADLFKLTPALHSIGLVKNFTLTGEPNYIELTQGVQNTVVDSQINANAIRATMEAYEYTAANISYGLGLDGSVVAPFTTVGSVATQVVGDNTVVVVSVGTGEGTPFVAGNTVAIEINTDDGVLIRKIVSKSSDALTLDYAIPTGTTIPVGAKVRKMNVVDIGAKVSQPYLAAQVTGVLGNGDRITLLIPKLRIVRGFSLAFTTQDYGNMPIEFTAYDLVSTDTYFSYFGGATSKLLRS